MMDLRLVLRNKCKNDTRLFECFKSLVMLDYVDKIFLKNNGNSVALLIVITNNLSDLMRIHKLIEDVPDLFFYDIEAITLVELREMYEANDLKGWELCYDNFQILHEKSQHM